MFVTDTITQMESNTNLQNFQRGRANLGKNNLDKNAFTQLLLAKLKYQDPTAPADNNEFLTQQAQLSQVEKLDNLVSLLQNNSVLTQASTLVGKTVEVKNQAGQTVIGKITNASLSNGSVGLLINGNTYTMDQVKTIFSN